MTSTTPRNLYLCFLILLMGLKLQAQFSKTHYIPPLTSHETENGLPLDQYLYISTPSATPVNLKIIHLDGSVINATASKTAPYRHSIGTGDNTRLFVPSTETNRIHKDKGYIVEADDLVYVTVKMNGGGNAQAGALVSKGLAGLGTEFRAGAFDNIRQPISSLTFISILATENNTEVEISDLGAGIQLINDFTGNGSDDFSINLNNGESYILAVRIDGNFMPANRDALIGTLIKSNKPIAVNCGSANGSNTNEGGGRDYGFDQIVSIELIGEEYIFTRAFGTDGIENPIIVAHENGTQIFINGSNSPFANLNAGEYLSIEGDQYSYSGKGANMYIRTSKPVFAYQAVGGTESSANQGLFFVPPLNCETPNTVDNIPAIQEIGNTNYTGGMSVLAETGAVLKINNINVGSLGGGISVIGPSAVAGNPNFVTYFIEGLSGNVSVESDHQVYVAAFGNNGAAAFGGYYSGFPFKPEVFYDTGIGSQGNCLPDITLSLNAITSYDTYQWYKNGVAIPGATNISFQPTEPGNYQVEGTILCSAFSLRSDDIPVSNCPDDYDGDGIVNAIDIDNDNDGIPDCSESVGGYDFQLFDPTSGWFPGGNYQYTGLVSVENTSAANPFIGSNDGRFVMDVPAGTKNAVSYETNFNKPLNVKLSYPTSQLLGDALITNDEKFAVTVPFESTVTVYNPDNQLLIDTNYDGIYESGVTSFSSFDLRFVLNSASLNFGEGTFSINAHQVDSFKITYTNNTDDAGNKVTFHLMANCIGLDSDEDGVLDHFDLDSDNDGVPDRTEGAGIIHNAVDPTDANGDGMYDYFTTITTPVDTDTDGVFDYLDLDSDNDGIYDLVESNSNALDANTDGIVDGNVGNNGLADALETAVDSGQINYTIADSDTDTFPNSAEVDSDDDLCFDVYEAGFTDDNGDGYLGDSPITVGPKGIVTSGSDGYTTPDNNYKIGAPVQIDTQPVAAEICENENITFSIETSTPDVIFQWQISSDGINWTDIASLPNHSGEATTSLTISNAPANLNNNQYRAVLIKTGNTCDVTSDEVTLTVNALPTLNTTTIEICQGESIDLTTLVTTDASATLNYFATMADALAGTPKLESLTVIPNNSTSYFVAASRQETETSPTCKTFDEIQITVNPIPVLTTSNAEICLGESIELNDLTTVEANTAIHYFTSLSDATLGVNELFVSQVSPTESISYFAKAIDTDPSTTTSCDQIKEIKIQVNTLPFLTTTDTQICIGESIDLSTLLAIEPNSSVRYFNSEANATAGTNDLASSNVSPTTNTTYYILVTDTDAATSTNCASIAPLTVQVNPLPTATPSNTEICSGDGVDLADLIATDPNVINTYFATQQDAEAGTPQLNSSFVTPTNTTSYFIVSTDNDAATTTSCQIINEVQVTVNPLPALSTTDTQICIGESIDLSTLVTQGPMSTLHYFESLADATIGSPELFVTTITPEASQSYFVKAIDTDPATSTSCTSIAEIKVQVNPLPTLNTTDLEICAGDGIELSTLVTTGANTAVSYHDSYAAAADGSVGLSTTFVSPATTTTYYIKAIDTDANTTTSCEIIKELTIQVNPLPVVATSDTEICFGEVIDLTSLVISDANTINTYYTTAADAQAGTSALNSTDISPGTSTTIYVVTTDTDASTITSCSTINEIQIQVNPLPAATITDTQICFGESIALSSQISTTHPYTIYTSLEDANTENSELVVTDLTPAETATYFTRVYDAITNCFIIEPLTITVNPLPAPMIQPGEMCLDATIDLTSLVALEDNTTALYFTTRADAEANTNPMTSTVVNPTVDTIYYLRTTSNAGCISIDEIALTVLPLPELQPVTIVQCDDDTDGFTAFNLTVKENEINSNHEDLIFTYYISELGAETLDPSKVIIDPTNYINRELNSDVVWVRVANSNTCVSITEVTLEVTISSLDSNFVSKFTACDDFLDFDGNDTEKNNDQDGITYFDFSSAENEIIDLLPSGQSYSITYYTNQEDALAEENNIPDISRHRNNESPFSQFIWVRIDSDSNNACYGLGPHIALEVEKIPSPQQAMNLELCDDDTDGLVDGFDLDSQIPTILGDLDPAEHIVTFHTSFADALDGSTSLNSPYTSTVPDRQTIYVRVENTTTGCNNPHGTFELITQRLPVVPTLTDIETCDGEEADGIVSDFDLAAKKSAVLQTQAAGNFVISFYRSADDATNGTNEITDNLYTNETPFNQTIYVRVENTETGCVNSDATFNLIVHEIPSFTVNPNQVVCTDNPDGLDLNIADATGEFNYIWTNSNGQVLGEDSVLKVYEKGIYTVTASIPSANTCTFSRQIEVIESNAPTIVDIIVNDGNDLGTIEVIVTGDGDYEYQLDDGDFVDSHILQNVPSGLHSITVNDKNACGSDTFIEITVLTFQKFMSPNGDNDKDVWTLDLGPDKATSYEKAEIKIFDRYGNLLKVLNVLSDDESKNSWDGTNNGVLLPKTDYWFSLELRKSNGQTILRSGHFSLLR